MSVTWGRRGTPLARRASEALARAYRERAQRRQRGWIGGSTLLRFAGRDTRVPANNRPGSFAPLVSCGGVALPASTGGVALPSSRASLSAISRPIPGNAHELLRGRGADSREPPEMAEEREPARASHTGDVIEDGAQPLARGCDGR